MKNKTGRAARKAGSMAEPKPPFPKQHQRAPGLESKLKPRPRYEARLTKAAGKLEGKIALITAAIPASAAQSRGLYAAKAHTSRSPIFPRRSLIRRNQAHCRIGRSAVPAAVGD